MVIHFEKRKNDQFREGSEVVIPSNEEKRSACVYRLLEYWRALSPAAGNNDYVFLDFPVTERSTNIDAEVNEKKHILYRTYKTALAKWMPGYVGAENAEEFLKRFGTKSGRAGGATAAIAAGVPREDVQAHGGWTSEAVDRYVTRGAEKKLSVGKAVLLSSPPATAPSAPVSQSADPAEPHPT